MSTLSTKKYTLEEFWELPDPPDRSKLELIGGVLYMTPPPGQKHDSVVARLNRLLIVFLEKTQTPGTVYVPRAAVWTSPATYLEPDLLYLTAETEAELEHGQRSRADIVVEVISRSSALYDRNTKANAYGVLGVKELWLIDELLKTVEVRVLVDGQLQRGELLEHDDLVRSTVLPGFEFAARQLF
jgi:Uma2 family endonuclease